jgi:hypothetical protein
MQKNEFLIGHFCNPLSFLWRNSVNDSQQFAASFVVHFLRTPQVASRDTLGSILVSGGKGSERLLGMVHVYHLAISY